MCFAKISKIIIIAKEILSHCLKRQIVFLKRRVRYLKSSFFKCHLVPNVYDRFLILHFFIPHSLPRRAKIPFDWNFRPS